MLWEFLVLRVFVYCIVIIFCFRLTQQNWKQSWYKLTCLKNIISELAYIDHSQARKTVTYEEGILWNKYHFVSKYLRKFLKVSKSTGICSFRHHVLRGAKWEGCVHTRRCVTQVSRTELSGRYTSKLARLFFSLTYHSQWKVGLCSGFRHIPPRTSSEPMRPNSPTWLYKSLNEYLNRDVLRNTRCTTSLLHSMVSLIISILKCHVCQIWWNVADIKGH